MYRSYVTYINVSHRLLLQIHLLRQDTDCPVTSLQTLFSELCDSAKVPVHEVRYLVKTCLSRLEGISGNDVEVFLTSGLDKMEFLGPHSKKWSVTKQLLFSISDGMLNLSDTDMGSHILPFISNGLLNEMNNFRNKQGLRCKVLLTWLSTLCRPTDFCTMSTEGVEKLLKNMKKELKRWQKRKGDTGGTSLLEEFASRSCLTSEDTSAALSTRAPAPYPEATSSETTVTADTTTSSVLLPGCESETESIPSSTLLLPSHGNSSGLHKSAAAISKKMSTSSGQTTADFDELVKAAENKALKEVIQDRENTISTLQKKLDDSRKRETALKPKVQEGEKMRSSLAHQLREKRRECSVLKQSNLYRRCSRLKVKLNQLTQQLAAPLHHSLYLLHTAPSSLWTASGRNLQSPLQ